MSKYTTEVRFICEKYSGLDESVGYDDVATVIANSRSKIFNFDYPIYDESYRSVLETKILKHFYTREIGAETVGLWKLWLDTRLNEIMPYYNQRYKSTLLEFNPFYDVDLTTDRDVKNDGSKNDDGITSSTINGTASSTTSGTKVTTDDTTITGSGNNETNSTGTSQNTSTESDNAWKYYSDTPQGGLEGIQSHRYLTNVTNDTASKNGTDNVDTTGHSIGSYSDSNVTDKDINETTNSTTNETTNSTTNGTNKLNSVFTNTEDYIEHVVGKRGGLSYSKMLEEFRQTFLNIDMEIIHELDDLFINLW